MAGFFLPNFLWCGFGQSEILSYCSNKKSNNKNSKTLKHIKYLYFYNKCSFLMRWFSGKICVCKFLACILYVVFWEGPSLIIRGSILANSISILFLCLFWRSSFIDLTSLPINLPRSRSILHNLYCERIVKFTFEKMTNFNLCR